MPFCGFSGGNSLYGVTPLENMFIIEYMPGAPAEFVKVYLYMLMLCAYPGDCNGTSDVASALKMDENTVLNALRYWEREGIMRRMSDNPPTYDLLPLSQTEQRTSQPGDEVYQNRDFNREMQALMPGLVLDSHELRMINDWQDVFGLDCDAILYMTELEMEKYHGKTLPTVQTVFKHLNTTAEDWAGKGIKGAESAKEYMVLQTSYAKAAEAVVHQFGQRRNPTRDEITIVKKWQDEWKLTTDDIIAACGETVKSASPSFAYLDKILESRVNGTADETQRSGVKAVCINLGILSRPTPAQMEAYESFLAMGFEPAAIEQAARWCGENNRRTFEDVKRKLEKWKAAGAFTVEAIEEERARQNKSIGIVNQVFEKAGIDKKVTTSDIRFVNVWTALLSTETVLVAAEFAQGTENPMKYIDKLIRVWSAQGINTPEKARESNERYHAQAQTAAAGKPGMITRPVTDDEFGQDFYTDIMNRKRPSEEKTDK